MNDKGSPSISSMAQSLESWPSWGAPGGGNRASKAWLFGTGVHQQAERKFGRTVPLLRFGRIGPGSRGFVTTVFVDSGTLIVSSDGKSGLAQKLGEDIHFAFCTVKQEVSWGRDSDTRTHKAEMAICAMYADVQIAL